MQKKALISISFALLSFSAQAFDISGQVLTKDSKINSTRFSNTSFNEDNAFCNKILEPICTGKNCEEEKKIQQYIYDSCKASVDEKIVLSHDRKNFPMGPVSFVPETYSGTSVFLSQLQELLTVSPDIHEVQYVLFVDFFNDVERAYRTFDNNNIGTSFAFTGKYLDNKRNANKPFHQVAYKWAENTMKDRAFIEKQITGIKNALASPQSLMDFKRYSNSLIPNITAHNAFTEYKNAVLADNECKVVFRYLNDDYISELYKQTQFECDRAKN